MTRPTPIQFDPAELDSLLACPSCDALLRDREVTLGEVSRCPRCHHAMETPRSLAMTRIMMLAMAALILVFAAVYFPFLRIDAAGFSSSSTVIETILAYSGSRTGFLSFTLAALIVFIPAARFIALIYVLGPMAIGWHPAPYAGTAFRIAGYLRPWAMAEIFIVGVAVALVKVAGLAHVTVGPAFWALVALVIVTIFKDTSMSRVTVWKTLNARKIS